MRIDKKNKASCSYKFVTLANKHVYFLQLSYFRAYRSSLGKKLVFGRRFKNGAQKWVFGNATWQTKNVECQNCLMSIKLVLCCVGIIIYCGCMIICGPYNNICCNWNILRAVLRASGASFFVRYLFVAWCFSRCLLLSQSHAVFLPTLLLIKRICSRNFTKKSVNILQDIESS